MAPKEALWKVVLANPASKAFEKAPTIIHSALVDCFTALERSPYRGPNIRPLTGQLRGLHRYRVGEWRVIYRLVESARRVEVIAILPRGGAYR
jgi:mRNA interferase RelE/StbE